MTNLIDDIKRDKAAGTPGVLEYDKYHQLKAPEGRSLTVWGLGVAHGSRDEETEANGRRMARFVAMEDALLAADDLADRFELLVQDLMNDEEADPNNLAAALCSLAGLREALEAGQ